MIREHDEFVWLHDRFTENEDYAGIMVCFFAILLHSERHAHYHDGSIFVVQIPPPPPRPNFDEPRIKLAKLREGEATMTKEEYNKMKQELEA